MAALAATDGTREYVWIRVTDWPDGEFVGTLEVKPANCPTYTKGQVMRVRDADVFDRAIAGPSGPVELALTDLVAMDFGVDLPG